MTYPFTQDLEPPDAHVSLRKMIPDELLARLDEALLDPLRRSGGADALHSRYQLLARYDIRREAFRAYAQRLRWMARQRAAASIALPLVPAAAGPQDRLHAQGHLLLAQKLIDQLGKSDLSIVELARLAQALAAMTRITAAGRLPGLIDDPDRAQSQRDALGGLVHDIYHPPDLEQLRPQDAPQPAADAPPHCAAVAPPHCAAVAPPHCAADAPPQCAAVAPPPRSDATQRTPQPRSDGAESRPPCAGAAPAPSQVQQRGSDAPPRIPRAEDPPPAQLEAPDLSECSP